MARKLRIEYAGAARHVMARGNQGRAVCADERDRKLWLEALGDGRLIQSDSGHWARQARRAAGAEAAETSLGAGL